MFFGDNFYYYIPVALQAVCVFHAYNRGTWQKWIWIIIFLPVIGSLIYIYAEIIANRRISKPNVDVNAIFNPGIKIKRLEDQLRFSDTFANKIALADAYLAAGQTQNAIELYTQSLTGAFAENEHVHQQLMVAYAATGNYQKVLDIGKKLYTLPQFARSQWHVLYALALESTGNIQQAEEEFKKMKGRYSYFAQRYQYGLFLGRTGRHAEANTIFQDMLNEQPHLTAVERKANAKWFASARGQLKKQTV